MTKTSNRVLKWSVLAGVVSSLAIACTVTTGGGSVDDSGGEGGSSSKAGTKSTGGDTTAGTAGKNTGGSSAGMTSGGTAGSGTAGTMTMGGTSTWEVGQCQSDTTDKTDPVPTMSPSCDPDPVKDKDNPCQVCMKAKCCSDWKTCFGSGPTSACFHGATDDAMKDPGQFDCIRFCFQDGAANAADPSKLLQDCAGMCTQQCDQDGAILDATNALVTCASAADADMGCADECFPFQ